MSITEKLLQNPGALCNMVRRLAIEAGDITLRYFDGELETIVEQKEDNSPVTIADREAEECILKGLKDITPEIPVVAEEQASAGLAPDVTGLDCFWLVDPLDATREFIAGREGYTVNIGLIKGGVPILGVVYAPAMGLLYAGAGPGRAIRWSKDTDKDNQKSMSSINFSRNLKSKKS
jgi:3'(2'), 5'-bisphosphate nucleotidase